MTAWGTAHFISRKAALRYYALYQYKAKDVDRKLKDKEIFIGKPSLKPNEKIFVSEGRYWVATEA